MTLCASIEARRPQLNRGRLSFNLPAGFGFPVAGMFSEPAPRNQRLLIGVDTILLDPPLGESLQIPVQHGVLVIDVQKESPADLAGVIIGDVIVSIDGQPITNAPDFVAFMATHSGGAQVLLQVNRKGTDRIIPVQISN